MDLLSFQIKNQKELELLADERLLFAVCFIGRSPISLAELRIHLPWLGHDLLSLLASDSFIQLSVDGRPVRFPLEAASERSIRIAVADEILQLLISAGLVLKSEFDRPAEQAAIATDWNTSEGTRSSRPSSPERVIFLDTTLREGEQSPGCLMYPEQKLRMAQVLAAVGVDIIEAGFSIASITDFESVRSIAREVGSGKTSPRIAALARCHREDIETAARSLEGASRSRVHVFLAASDLLLEHQYRMGRAEALDKVGAMVRLACSYVEDVQFSAVDATRSDIDFLLQMVATAIQAGAKTISLPDTVGYALPSEYRALFETLIDRTPDANTIVFSAHCHNDLGLATANSLAGLQGGARQVEVSVNGVGERAGMAPLEEVAAVMMVRRAQLPFTNNIVMDRLTATSQLLSELTTFRAAPNKAVVGTNAFAHGSGLHQRAMHADPLTYEIMTPSSVGSTTNRMVLTRQSGPGSLKLRLEKLGYNIDSKRLDFVYRQFTELAITKKEINDEDLIGLMERLEISKVPTHYFS